MQIKKNKTLSILRDKTGGSLLFILGMMLLLMAIGVSALVAAGASAGAALNQNSFSQLNLHADSVIKTVMYGIQENDADEGSRVDSAEPVIEQPQTLGGQLVRAMYLNEDIDASLPAALNTALLDGAIPVVLPITTEPIVVEFDFDVITTDFQPAIFDDNDDGPPFLLQDAVPKSATINARVKFEFRFEQTAGQSERAVNYELVYELRNAEIVMQEVYNGNFDPELIVAPDSFIMVIEEPLDWRVLSYEKMDND
jgi:hypothetical protein